MNNQIRQTVLKKLSLGFLCLTLSLVFCTTVGFSKDTDFPPKPNPPRLVNDFAGMMTPTQQDNLEEVLQNFARETSTQIVVVTINSLGNYEPAQYVLELGRRWGVGQKDKNNGVIIFVSKDDNKINISPGQGLEGALPDITCARIIRNEMTPAFKEGNYYSGFENAANAVIQATKGEYKADDVNNQGDTGFPIGALFGVIIIVIVVISLLRSGGGGGKGGNYMSRRGGSFLTGAILGDILGGMSGRGGFGGGGGFGSSGGGGGFGGFGGGSFGGGGASGSW